jgi:hypothetical protein
MTKDDGESTQDMKDAPMIGSEKTVAISREKLIEHMESRGLPFVHASQGSSTRPPSNPGMPLGAPSTYPPPRHEGVPSFLAQGQAPQPPRPVQALQVSRVASAKAASDAAIAAIGPASNAPRTIKRNVMRRALVDLLWFDPKLPKRLRRESRFAAVLKELGANRRALDAIGVSDRTQEEADAVDVNRVLSACPPAPLHAVRSDLDDALADIHSFDVPLFVIAGILRPTFDVVQTLKLLVSIAQPFTGTDKRVAAAVQFAEGSLASPIPPGGKSLQRIVQQVEQALAGLSLPLGYVNETVERALIDERKYAYRTVYGQRRIRCDFDFDGVSIPIYCPEDVAMKFPLLTAFPIMALAEMRPREDVAEAHSEALLVWAIARTVRATNP